MNVGHTGKLGESPESLENSSNHLNIAVLPWLIAMGEGPI